MIVTEEEAKTKRCQEAFGAAPHLNPTGETIYRKIEEDKKIIYKGADYISTANAPSYCLGSGCMAWIPVERVFYSSRDVQPGPQWEKVTHDKPEIGAKWFWQSKRGRCGKVGVHE